MTKTTKQELSGKDAYTLKSANSAAEAARLDALNVAITLCNNGRPAPVDLNALKPKSILEVGSGGGAWALQAATTWPDAEVIAVDIVPLPDRPLPSNIKFQLADVTQELPFEPQSFDIIHVRFILMHVPHASAVLKKLVPLLRPGGWIGLEEPDCDAATNTYGPVTPGLQKVSQAWYKIIRSRHGDPSIGSALKGELEANITVRWDRIEEKVLHIAFSGQSEDPSLGQLGDTWRDTAIQVAHQLAGTEGFAAEGVTADDIRAHDEELLGPENGYTLPMYFVWAKRN